MKTLTALLAIACVIATVSVAAAGDRPDVVNINTASAEQLQLLPRVGPALAERIIEYREANGPFRTADEIVAVKGIGDSAFEKLKPYLVTSGATTLSEKVRLARPSSSSGASSG
jgi:competence protein ComEA